MGPAASGRTPTSSDRVSSASSPLLSAVRSRSPKCSMRRREHNAGSSDIDERPPTSGSSNRASRAHIVRTNSSGSNSGAREAVFPAPGSGDRSEPLGMRVRMACCRPARCRRRPCPRSCPSRGDTDLWHERVEAVLIGTRRDDLAVEVGGGVEVVVVVVESSIGQRLGLTVGKHPEFTHVSIPRSATAYRLRNLVDLSSFGGTPLPCRTEGTFGFRLSALARMSGSSMRGSGCRSHSEPTGNRRSPRACAGLDRQQRTLDLVRSNCRDGTHVRRPGGRGTAVR